MDAAAPPSEDSHVDLDEIEESIQYTEAGKTVGQQQQMFHKSAKRLTQLVSLYATVQQAHLTILQFTAMSKAHGIEAAFIMAGSIINQDALLGYSYTMPGAEDVSTLFICLH